MERAWMDEENEANRNRAMLSNNPQYKHDLGGVKLFSRINGLKGSDFGAVEPGIDPYKIAAMLAIAFAGFKFAQHKGWISL